MPRFLPTILAALIFILLVAIGVSGALAISREPDIEFTGPGEFRFSVTVPSYYTVWHRATASIDGVYSVNDPKLPAGTRISIEHGGAIVPSKALGGNYTTGNEKGDRLSVLSFNATEPGDYVIKLSGFEETRAFDVTRGRGVGPVFTIVGWFAAAGLACLVSIVLLVLALLRKFPRSVALVSTSGN